MATLTIHNIPDDLLEKLERSARENSRAVDEEAVLWLSQIQAQPSLDRLTTEEMIRSFRELRNRYPDSYVTAEDVTRGKREGRLGDATVESDQEPDPWLERARKTRESMPGVYIKDEEELNRFKREGRLGEYESAYSIALSRFSSPMKPEEFIEYTQQLSRKLEGKVWATEEEVNRAKREGRL